MSSTSGHEPRRSDGCSQSRRRSSTEDLSPGDVVVVHGEGFSPGAIVWVSLCAGPPGQPELRYTCGPTSGSEQHVDGDGGIVVEFEIPDLGWEEMTGTTMCPGEDCESGGPGAERSVSARCDGVESSCAITVEHHLQGAVPAPPTWAPAPVLITFD